MNDLERISELARLQLELEDQVATLEEQLKTKQEHLRKVAEQDLPEAMESVGMQEFTLTNGRKVGIEAKIHASISEARRAEAFKWLRETNNDGIIKREVSVKFGKGDDVAADSAAEALAKVVGWEHVLDKESVHHSTLRAFIRDLLEEGVDFPQDAFGVHRRTVAVIR